MKLKIFERTQSDEKEVFLKLVERNDGVTVVAVNIRGDEYMCGNLVTFERNGKLTIHGSVNDDLGFELDKRGCISTTE